MTAHLDAHRTPAAPRGHGPGRGGRAVLLVLWIALGLAPIVPSVEDVELATGVIGAPGTLTVERCVHLPSRNRNGGRYDCDGVFVPDGGAPVAVDAPPESSVGDVGRARLTPEGDRAEWSGPAGVLAALTLPWFAVAVLAFVPWALRWAPGGVADRRLAVGGGLVACLAAVGVVAGLLASYA